MVKDELDDVQRKAGIEAISYATWDDALGLELLKASSPCFLRLRRHEEAAGVPKLLCREWRVKGGEA